MKALKYIAGICLALSLTSCDDFLTKTSPDELTSGNYWRNKSDAESGMAAVYSQMYFGDEWSFPEVKWPVEAYRQDDVEMGSDAQNYQNWVQLRDLPLPTVTLSLPLTGGTTIMVSALPTR